MSKRSDEMKACDYPPDPWTVVKHGVYRRYIDCWLPKILQVRQGQRPWHNGAVIVDAFSGSGEYKGGLPGSSMVVARSFETHQARDRFQPLELITLEERADRTAALHRRLRPIADRTPGFTATVLEPGRFAERQRDIERSVVAREAPTLWLLDPYGYNIPWEAVSACAERRGHEVIVTLMLQEAYRFREDEAMARVIDGVMGSTEWRRLPLGSTQESVKRALVDAYQARLRTLGCDTGSFDIRVGPTARYSLVYATHHQQGLVCWNRAAWSIDANAGSGAHSLADELTLFGAETDKLEAWLLAQPDLDLTWQAMTEAASRIGFLESHLRTVLSDLGARGRATLIGSPVAPTKRSPWPTGCVVRILPEVDDPLSP